MRKAILILLLILFALSTSAYAYEISLSGNIDLQDSISAVATDSLSGIVAAASKTSNILYIIDVNKNIVINKYALAFTPVGLAMDEKRGLLIIVSDNGTLRQFDIKNGEVIKTITPGMIVDHIAIHKESDTLYLAGDKHMQARDLETFSVIKELELPFPVTSMAIDRGGLFLLLATPRTPKTIRPPQPNQILSASCLR